MGGTGEGVEQPSSWLTLSDIRLQESRSSRAPTAPRQTRRAAMGGTRLRTQVRTEFKQSVGNVKVKTEALCFCRLRISGRFRLQPAGLSGKQVRRRIQYKTILYSTDL